VREVVYGLEVGICVSGFVEREGDVLVDYVMFRELE
jgi:hypothetical protein